MQGIVSVELFLPGFFLGSSRSIPEDQSSKPGRGYIFFSFILAAMRDTRSTPSVAGFLLVFQQKSSEEREEEELKGGKKKNKENLWWLPLSLSMEKGRRSNRGLWQVRRHCFFSTLVQEKGGQEGLIA